MFFHPFILECYFFNIWPPRMSHLYLSSVVCHILCYDICCFVPDIPQRNRIHTLQKKNLNIWHIAVCRSLGVSSLWVFNPIITYILFSITMFFKIFFLTLGLLFGAFRSSASALKLLEILLLLMIAFCVPHCLVQ